MNTEFSCDLGLALLAGVTAAAGVAGYWLGRWREQLALLEIFHPEI